MTVRISSRNIVYFYIEFSFHGSFSIYPDGNAAVTTSDAEDIKRIEAANKMYEGLFEVCEITPAYHYYTINQNIASFTIK